MMRKARGPIRLAEPGTQPPGQTEEWRCPGWGTAYSHAPKIAEWLAPDGSHDRRFRARPREGFLGELTGGMARSYGRCWGCSGSLGCTMCTTSNVLEVLCRKCAAWGTFEAFDHHGPIVANPKVPAPARFEEYPEAWRKRYAPLPTGAATSFSAPKLKDV